MEEYRGSDESLVGFCKRENLCISPMRVWVRKFYPSEVARAKSVKNTNFIPVTVQELKKDIHFTDQQQSSKQNHNYLNPEWVGQVLAEVIRRLS